MTHVLENAGAIDSKAREEGAGLLKSWEKLQMKREWTGIGKTLIIYLPWKI